jgi:hypothetical protein
MEERLNLAGGFITSEGNHKLARPRRIEGKPIPDKPEWRLLGRFWYQIIIRGVRMAEIGDALLMHSMHNE